MIKSKHPDWGIIKPIKNAGASSIIVQFLRQDRVSRMENDAEEPTGAADISKPKVVLFQRVVLRYPRAHFRKTVMVSEEIEQRKDNRRWFLDAQETIKGPFAMILNDWFQHRRVSRKSPIGDDVLTDIVAVCRTSPEKESEVESF